MLSAQCSMNWNCSPSSWVDGYRCYILSRCDILGVMDPALMVYLVERIGYWLRPAARTHIIGRW
jgi:hypothetical protein